MHEFASPALSVPLLLIFVLLLLLLLLQRKNIFITRPYRFPTGPPILPVLGNFMWMGRNPVAGLQQMATKYGKVYSIFIGSMPLVVVNSYQLVKEVLMSHDFSDRPYIPLMEIMKQNLGIVGAPYGEAWKRQRRFTLSTLRNFGFGRKTIEERILTEAKVLMETFKQEATAFDPHFNINNAVSNIICSLVFGSRFDYVDQDFQELLHLIEENLVLQGGLLGQICNIFPVLCKLPGPQQRMLTSQAKVQALVDAKIAEHRATLDPSNPRDLIDAYLAEIEKEKGDPNSPFKDKNLSMVTLDLFIAGTETTSTTLRWTLLYMMAYPDIQAACHKEIDEVVGADRLPAMEDRPKMPFVDAVIHESQRFSNIVPLGLVHSTLKDVEFENYLLPKGTMVLTNFTSVLFDESQWEAPHEFNPGRFLDGSGKFVKPDAFLVFSAGPRVCLGENLARMELFLFFTSLLQRFQFYWPDPASKPNLEPKYQFTQAPQPYKMGVRPRNS
ncbi:cytochrome P450 2D15-like [Lethenteron reissneri]|uniref:cytochrome P450 2D15-like n=1 Tax=Lethenteron reissneri TaxID=7753 RepID=UPI002AB6F83D|nr:cytochrome P450 2D15-like [Lethenteron reissneri]